MCDPTPAERALPQMIVGAWFTQGIYAAAELGIADALARGPLELAELAWLTQARPGPLRRLLRALCAIGIFSLDQQGRYTLTPLAELLRSDVANSQRGLALMAGAEFYRSWGGLAESVRNGRPAFDETFGVPFVESCVQAFTHGPRPRERDGIGGDIDARDFDARPRSEDGYLSRPAGYVKHGAPRLYAPSF